jgi:hypothetical protein
VARRRTRGDRKRVDSEMREEVEEFQALGAQHRDGNSVCPRMCRMESLGGTKSSDGSRSLDDEGRRYCFDVWRRRLLHLVSVARPE